MSNLRQSVAGVLSTTIRISCREKGSEVWVRRTGKLASTVWTCPLLRVNSGIQNLLIKISDGGRAAIFEGPYYIGNVLGTHAACSIQEYKRHWSANVCLDVAGGSLLGQSRFARGNCGLNFRTKYRVVEENVIAMGE